jgi:hypothetical protein
VAAEVVAGSAERMVFGSACGRHRAASFLACLCRDWSAVCAHSTRSTSLEGGGNGTDCRVQAGDEGRTGI